MREPPKKLRPSACGHAKSNHIFDLDSERKDNIKCKMPPDATTTSNMQKMRPDTKQISVKSFMFEVGMGFFSVDLVCKWLYLVWKMCTRLELDTNHRESSLFNIRIIAAWIASTFADLFNDPKIMCSMVIFMSFVIDVNGKRTEDNWSYLISLCTHQSELKWIRDCWLVVSSWINSSF